MGSPRILEDIIHIRIDNNNADIYDEKGYPENFTMTTIVSSSFTTLHIASMQWICRVLVKGHNAIGSSIYFYLSTSHTHTIQSDTLYIQSTRNILICMLMAMFVRTFNDAYVYSENLSPQHQPRSFRHLTW